MLTTALLLSLMPAGAGISHAVTSKPQSEPVSKRLHKAAVVAPTPQSSGELEVSPAFCRSVLDKVDALVSKEFWKADSVPIWKSALAGNREKILASKNLIELSTNLNTALKALHASHTQFVTINDETFYFLHTLFQQRRPREKQLLMDFTGAITGGVNCKPDQIRYVLDGSPADTAGLKAGDLILTVDGVPYIGQSCWFGKSGKSVPVRIQRPGDNEPREVQVKPISANAYKQYLAATSKSVNVTRYGDKNIGYIHVWCGGQAEHDVLEDELGGKVLQGSDALIFDIRDGYGGNYYNDLDYFYRPAAGFPPFKTTSRKGEVEDNVMYYDKPVVALINGGSRSGKELVAYSLKQTGRARLVGERTAGYVLGGRLFSINDRCALYLAVQGVQAGCVNLEGTGVAPDIEVKQPCESRGKEDLPRAEAVRLLTGQR